MFQTGNAESEIWNIIVNSDFRKNVYYINTLNWREEWRGCEMQLKDKGYC